MLAEETNSPWLDYDFEIIDRPPSLVGALIFIWILFLANKISVLSILIFIFIISFFIFRRVRRG